MPDELHIIPIQCPILLSDLYLIQPAFHELVLVPSSGRLSPLYCHIFTVFLSFIFYTCPVFARVGVGSLFCVHLKHLTNLFTGWIAVSHQPLCFASLISHPIENTLYYMVDVHQARTSLRTHPVTMATSINAQIFLPAWRVPFWEQNLQLWQPYEIGSNSIFRSMFANTLTYLQCSFCPKISCGSWYWIREIWVLNQGNIVCISGKLVSPSNTNQLVLFYSICGNRDALWLH